MLGFRKAAGVATGSISTGAAGTGAALRAGFRLTAGGGGGIGGPSEKRGSGPRGGSGAGGGASGATAAAAGRSCTIRYAATPAMNRASRIAPTRRPRRMSSRNRTLKPSARRRLRSRPKSIGILPEFSPQTLVRRLLRRAAAVRDCASECGRRCSSGAANRHCRRGGWIRRAHSNPWLRAKIDRR